MLSPPEWPCDELQSIGWQGPSTTIWKAGDERNAELFTKGQLVKTNLSVVQPPPTVDFRLSRMPVASCGAFGRGYSPNAERD